MAVRAKITKYRPYGMFFKLIYTEINVFFPARRLVGFFTTFAHLF